MPGINNWITRLKANHLLRYLIVGSFNTAFSYAVYALFLYIGLDYKLANLSALIIGIVLSFKTQGHFVFRNSDNRLFGRFLASWAIIYVVTIAIIGQIINLGFNAYWAGAFAMPFSVGLSYLAQKYFVFHRA